MNNQNNMRDNPAGQPLQQDVDAPQPRDESQGAGNTLTIVDLLRTSRELSEALTPLAPRPAFRAELRDELILSAQRQYARRILAGDFDDQPVAQEGVSRRLVLGAAAVGLSFRRQRDQRDGRILLAATRSQRRRPGRSPQSRITPHDASPIKKALRNIGGFVIYASGFNHGNGCASGASRISSRIPEKSAACNALRKCVARQLQFTLRSTPPTAR